MQQNFSKNKTICLHRNNKKNFELKILPSDKCSWSSSKSTLSCCLSASWLRLRSSRAPPSCRPRPWSGWVRTEIRLDKRRRHQEQQCRPLRVWSHAYIRDGLWFWKLGIESFTHLGLIIHYLKLHLQCFCVFLICHFRTLNVFFYVFS